MKTCPLCRESILEAAIVCKHCHRDVPSVPDPTWRGKERFGPFYWGMSRQEVMSFVTGEREEFPTGSVGFRLPSFLGVDTVWNLNLDILDDRVIAIFAATGYSAESFMPLTIRLTEEMIRRFGVRFLDMPMCSEWCGEETSVDLMVGFESAVLQFYSVEHAPYFKAWREARRA
jgi:hypothetical protein